MKKGKILSIMLIMLIITTIPVTTGINIETEPKEKETISFQDQIQPKLEIGEISGGILGISTEIINKGEEDVTNIKYFIDVFGGIRRESHNPNRGINIRDRGDILTLKPGEKFPIKTIEPIFGLGWLRITVRAFVEGEYVATKLAEGKALLFLTIVTSEQDILP